MNWSAFSNVVKITTPVPKTGLPPISDLAAQSGDTPGSLKLTWTVPEHAAQYQIYYSPDSIGQYNLPSAKLWAETPDGSCGDLCLEGLEPGTLYWVAMIYSDSFGNVSPLSNVVSASSGADPGLQTDDPPVPAEFTLSQNYPNPFNPITIIEFSHGESGPVTLEIFNIVGQKVTTLAEGISSPGTHSVIWDGTDSESCPAASGIYLYRLRSCEGCEVKRMLLLK